MSGKLQIIHTTNADRLHSWIIMSTMIRQIVASLSIASITVIPLFVTEGNWLGRLIILKNFFSSEV